MAQGSTADLINKALEKGGNLTSLNAAVSNRIIDLLRDIRMELRIQNELLVQGLSLTKQDLASLRNDPYYSQD